MFVSFLAQTYFLEDSKGVMRDAAVRAKISP